MRNGSGKSAKRQWLKQQMCGYRVGTDVGGTFTDLVAINEVTGELLNIKLPSTPRTPAAGVMEAFREFFQTTRPEDVTAVSHATTIAVNALLGQVGLELPAVGLITTAGFRDVLEIGRQRRSELYNLFIQRPRMLVSRRYRYELEERVGFDGKVIKKLDPKSLRRIVTKLKKDDLKAVAIGFLYSYKNPEHEREVKRVLEKKCPCVFVTASHEIAPEHREYERISTAVVNSVLMPIVSVYMEELSEKIAALGITSPLCVMQSNGGIASKEVIARQPVSIVESGPAAGVVASAYYGKLLGINDVVSFDMGGTTAKAGLVRGGVPEIVTEYEVAGKVHSGRVVKGSGYPVRFPFIDLAEASAGGGTIAWVDEGVALRVGPLSAGADPGPACYGKADEPTVTDANLILGRLNPEHLLAGKMKIFEKLSKKSIEEKICSKTGLKLTEAAAGVIRIVNSSMSKILRIVSVERGYDPRQFTLIAFGGAGPMHACALAEELSISKIIVPGNPGLFSALGLLATDFTHSGIRPVMKEIDTIGTEELEEIFEDLYAQGYKIIESQKVPPRNMVFLRQLDMRYFGQGYELIVSVPEKLTEGDLSSAKESFHSKHESVYGYAAREEPIELVNARLVSIGVVARPKLPKQELADSKPSSDALLTKRKVYFEKYEGYVECPIYVREKMVAGNVILGPAVIEQYDATTVVYPDWDVHVNKIGSIEMSIKE